MDLKGVWRRVSSTLLPGPATLAAAARVLEEAALSMGSAAGLTTNSPHEQQHKLNPYFRETAVFVRVGATCACTTPQPGLLLVGDLYQGCRSAWSVAFPEQKECFGLKGYNWPPFRR